VLRDSMMDGFCSSPLGLGRPSPLRPLGALLGGALLYGLVRLHRAYRLKRLRAAWASTGSDVVVLHHFPRPRNHPSLTPFGVKLETFLRMMGIKYVVDFEEPMGPKRKNPWITLGGEDHSDSQLIAEMLMERFSKNPDEGLSPEQRAVGTAVRVTLEEHLYWGLVSWRYIEDDCRGMFTLGNFNFAIQLAIRSFKGKVKQWLDGQGVGRHSVEDLHRMMLRDLQVFADCLGDKPFLLGEEPHVDDCAVFGFLAVALYGVPGSVYEAFVRDTPNVIAYVERMKARYWPDWDQCVGQH